ncbi:MAG: SDR family oxidoreductase [Pseudolabrys sp.]|jgi:NAD(P)-dependent dehydrogenase (short-subunit alcohol dehydrogenase family)
MTETRNAAPQSWLGLEGRLCVVTGAGGGIGRATALSFAAAGARLVLLDRNEETLAGTAQALANVTDAPPLLIACDVTNPADVKSAAERTLRVAGTPAVLVNNAGLLRAAPLATVDLEAWHALLAVNLTGYLLCAQAFGAAMRGARSGAIVHVASIAGTQPQSFSGAYSVSKSGVLMLSQQLAVEWGPSGLRSNVVSPGMVETPMSQSFYDADGVRERRSAVVPLGRIGQPQDMADTILYLASDRASYVNGQEVLVDGGYSRMLMSLVPRPGYEQKAS